MVQTHSRRFFLKALGAAAITPSIISTMESCHTSAAAAGGKDLFFKISLAEWSLHKTLFAGQMTNLDFPVMAKRDFGIENVEYVNQFFKDKARDKAYLKDLKMRCDDNGVRSVLIMCDGEGYLGDLDEGKRKQAIENHYKWVEAAKFLGCHSIRVNAYGDGTREEVAKAAVDGLTRLSQFAETFGLNVIVENHGSYSSSDGWLPQVMKTINRKNCGILPDFGNFCTKYEGSGDSRKCVEMGDRYKITEQFMPYAIGVSAKSYDFDANGDCIETDYRRMLKIVKAAGYKSFVGIEYEGSKLSEVDGIKATLALLKKVGAELG